MSVAEVKIERVITAGTFSLDGETFDVDNNVWVLGDHTECVVFDGPHEVPPIVELVAGRSVRAILCTHAHDDHVRIAPELADELGAPILLHPDDLPVWQLTHPDHQPDGELHDGQQLKVGGAQITVLHTPGHTPGGCCFWVPELGVLFSGDTLFNGGPGATGRSFSDHGTIVASIKDRLFALPDDTIVKTGHGEDTTIGAEKTGLG